MTIIATTKNMPHTAYGFVSGTSDLIRSGGMSSRMRFTIVGVSSCGRGGPETIMAIAAGIPSRRNGASPPVRSSRPPEQVSDDGNDHNDEDGDLHHEEGAARRSQRAMRPRSVLLDGPRRLLRSLRAFHLGEVQRVGRPWTV